MQTFDVYTGSGQNRSAEAKAISVQPLLYRQAGRYLAAPELVEAVNIALAVGQPLLVTGEPGCGKTTLAWSVAAELGLGEPLLFHTRSTSRAQDLLYRFDAVLRFYDIQLKVAKAQKAEEYIHWEPLGEAIRSSVRRLVLIDEIDKAPRDFPNDLLNELDRMEFSVPEMDHDLAAAALPRRSTFKATHRPVVIITSNTERQLPLPFLRRCVFHHIAFPSADVLKKIVNERLGDLRIPSDLLKEATDKFLQVRELQGLVKRPATGEFLAWMQALVLRGISASRLSGTSLANLPLWQALIKDREDEACLRGA
jgi:MoxR-like ATPase